MGCDFKAKAVIGIKIRLADIPTKHIVEKAFDHSYSAGMRFDPQTGRKLWKESHVPEIAFSEEYEGDLDAGTKLITVTNAEAFDDGYGEDLVFGFGVDGTNSNGGATMDFCTIPDTELLKKNLKKALEPYGLWEENKFGLYTILYCGC